MQNQNKVRHIHVIPSFIFSAIFIGLALFLAINKQYVIDLISFYQYKPNQEVANIIDTTGVNERGKFLFYASQPRLESTSQFNQFCDRVEQTTSVLGCYNDYRIYIYYIKEDQLYGINEVTAAHEMLHAAYDRLTIQEREDFSRLVETEYNKLKNIKSFEERMQYYEKAEPGQRDNELHSIIGTEVADISPELEKYYQKYFSDRRKVVSLYEKYIQVFHELDNKAESLSNLLNKITKEINTEVSVYNQSVQALNSQIKDFNQRASNGDFFSEAEFYYERALIINKIEDLNIMRDQINEKISQYNKILDEYNSIVIKSNKLYNSMDSTLAPAPAI